MATKRRSGFELQTLAEAMKYLNTGTALIRALLVKQGDITKYKDPQTVDYWDEQVGLCWDSYKEWLNFWAQTSDHPDRENIRFSYQAGQLPVTVEDLEKAVRERNSQEESEPVEA